LSDERFDQLTRLLGQRRSRRSVLKGLAAAMVASVGAARGALAQIGGPRCKLTTQPCSAGSECCSGYCDDELGTCCLPEGNVCRDDSHCCGGLTCRGQRCLPVGGEDDVCDSDADCAGDLVCCGDVCVDPDTFCPGELDFVECECVCLDGEQCGEACCGDDEVCDEELGCVPAICPGEPWTCPPENQTAPKCFETCLCLQSADDPTTSVCGSQAGCMAVDPCETSADCPDGHSCVINTCCGPQGLCAPPCGAIVAVSLDDGPWLSGR
jgi:hypothetical protein